MKDWPGLWSFPWVIITDAESNRCCINNAATWWMLARPDLFVTLKGKQQKV